MGKKLQNVISMARKDGYLDVPDHVIGDLSNVNDKMLYY